MPVPHADFHEVWWIYSPMKNREWAGLRIAHFRKTVNGALVVTITGEIDQRRIGLRVWDDIKDSEHWHMIKQIPIPNSVEVMTAVMNDGEEVETVETESSHE